MPWAWTKTMDPSISLSFPLNHKNVISDWLISDPTHCWTGQPSTIYLQVNSTASYLETPLECCVVLRKMGNAKKETSPWFRNELCLKTVWITHNPTSILWEKNCCVYTQTEAPWIIKVRNKQELVVVEHSSDTILWQDSSHCKLIKFRVLRLQHTHKILTWEFKLFFKVLLKHAQNAAVTHKIYVHVKWKSLPPWDHTHTALTFKLVHILF